MPDLSGRIAVVTGSTRGIGNAIARALLECGASVVVSSSDEGRSRAAAEALAERTGGTTLGVACDVRDAAACAHLVDAAVDHFGRLDILVNNAGIGVFAPLLELAPEDFRDQIEINLIGVYSCSRAAAPHLIASGDGWIVNIGSLAGRNPFAGGTAYNASKFGLIGLTEAMMLDLRHDGVRVSLVMPGSVDTGFRDESREGTRSWAVGADDVARAVIGLFDQPANTHVSRVEMRPSKPPRR